MRQTTLTQSGVPGRVIAWTISHTSTQYIDFVDFLHFTGFTCLTFILLILVGVELPLWVVVTLSWNAVSCFLESSRV